MKREYFIILIDLIAVTLCGSLLPSLSVLAMLIIVLYTNIPLYKKDFNKTIIFNYILIILNYLIIIQYNSAGKNLEDWSELNLFFLIIFFSSTIIMIAFAVYMIEKQARVILLTAIIITASASISFLIFLYMAKAQIGNYY